MNIKVLCDDRAINPNFEHEHGFSLLITTDKQCTLFDVGQSDVFLKNAKKFGIDLSKVDRVVLSHGHYDHCNGLLHFLEINSHAIVYMHQNALDHLMHGDKYVGVLPALKEYKSRYRFLTGELQLDDEFSIISSAVLPPASDHDFAVFVNGEQIQDTFKHELYLLCKQNQKTVLFTGCSHRGIERIAEYSVSHGVTHIVGGFHLTNDFPPHKLIDVVQNLSAHPILYFTGHCTSSDAWQYMKQLNSRQFSLMAAGDQFTIGSHGEKACALFRQGYNCSQAVLGAFADDLNLDRDVAMKLACSFGGGIGRMREVCGAVSGMMMVCGILHGYSTPETGAVKAEHYRLVQEMAHEFRSQTDSLICRDLLGGTASTLPTPTARTNEFYAQRPCERLIFLAASIAEKHM